jgi:DNA topoisomerase-1
MSIVATKPSTDARAAREVPAARPRRARIAVVVDPEDSARDAQLRYVSDADPGITRVRSGRGFRYRLPDGGTLRDPEALARIRALAIPPAWTSVWICPRPDGHVQATGRDARGRKQYRYHARFRAVREETKYGRLLLFGAALPRIRARVEEDLGRRGLPREKVLALVVRLLERTLIRVGNREYTRQNRSFGLTTMRGRHVDVAGSTVRFEFRGKSGKWQSVRITDRRLAALVRRCQEMPGQELFQYDDPDDGRRSIGSSDVNAYLREITGEEFTAKDFRTWAATVLAAGALRDLAAFDATPRAKRELAGAVEAVAKKLGNTPAVCRKCYVHPTIVDAWMEGITVPTSRPRARGSSLTTLSAEESAVLALLHKRLAAPSPSPAAG